MEPWVIRWKDREWKSADQSTLVHIAVANEYGREDQWQARSPWNGQEALAAWLTVLFTAEIGDVAAARLVVHMMPVADFYGCLQTPEPPPDAGQPAPVAPAPTQPPSSAEADEVLAVAV